MSESRSGRVWVVCVCAWVLCAATCRQDPSHLPLPPDAGAEPDAGGHPEEDVPSHGTPCAEGMEPTEEGECCWPGQSWDLDEGLCRGEPRCPEGRLPHEGDCVAVDADEEALEEACSEGIEAACSEWLSAMERRCADVEAAACGKLARVLEGRGAKERAGEFYALACDAGVVDDCLRGAELLRSDGGWDDLDGAAGLLSKACAGASTQGCAMWLDAAVEGCRQGACDWALTERLAVGLEAEMPAMVADQRAALCLSWVSKDLSLERDNPCRALTAFALIKRDPLPEGMPTPRALLSVACTGLEDPPRDYLEMADPAACVHLGERLVASGQKQGLAQAAGLFRRGCAVDIPDACLRLGGLYRDGRGVSRDDRRAVRLFQEACDGGMWSGCTQLGWMMARGRGLDRDRVGATDLYDRACDAGEPLGCHHLALLLLATDEARALRLFKKACDAGHKESCGRF